MTIGGDGGNTGKYYSCGPYYFWVQKYGKEKVGEFFNRLKIYRSLDAAFKSCFNMNFEEFSEKWEKEIKKIIDSKKVLYPKDVITINKYGFQKTKKPENLNSVEKIVDGGKETFKEIKEKIKESKFIVWNGPFGWYEKGYHYLTKKVAKEIAKSDAFSVVGRRVS